eukprot:143724-Prymnesium_polylepis.1
MAGALDEITAAWAGQLVGLASSGLGLVLPIKAPTFTELGGETVQLLTMALEGGGVDREGWEALMEQLVAMTGRAASAEGPAGLAGLLKAWAESASPSLVASCGQGHVQRLLKANASSYEPSKGMVAASVGECAVSV